MGKKTYFYVPIGDDIWIAVVRMKFSDRPSTSDEGAGRLVRRCEVSELATAKFTSSEELNSFLHSTSAGAEEELVAFSALLEELPLRFSQSTEYRLEHAALWLLRDNCFAIKMKKKGLTLAAEENIIRFVGVHSAHGEFILGDE